jgi:hypothetical protein
MDSVEQLFDNCPSDPDAMTEYFNALSFRDLKRFRRELDRRRVTADDDLRQMVCDMQAIQRDEAEAAGAEPPAAEICRPERACAVPAECEAPAAETLVEEEVEAVEEPAVGEKRQQAVEVQSEALPEQACAVPAESEAPAAEESRVGQDREAIDGPPNEDLGGPALASSLVPPYALPELRELVPAYAVPASAPEEKVEAVKEPAEVEKRRQAVALQSAASRAAEHQVYQQWLESQYAVWRHNMLLEQRLQQEAAAAPGSANCAGGAGLTRLQEWTESLRR